MNNKEQTPPRQDNNFVKEYNEIMNNKSYNFNYNINFHRNIEWSQPGDLIKKFSLYSERETITSIETTIVNA